MKRTSELLFYVTFGAGMAFGTSSFTMMSELFKRSTVGWVVVGIVLAGLFCVLISSAVAEMASMYPSAPGVRTYLKFGLSNRVSLVLVYQYLFFMVLVAGIESYMFALVVRAAFPSTDPLNVVLALLLFTVIVNLLGLELPRGLQIVTTLALIGTALVLGVYGMSVPPAAPPPIPVPATSPSSWVVLPGLVVLGIYLYVGFEWVTMLGFRPAAYAGRIPVSMPLAILLNVLAYSAFVTGMAAYLSRAEIAATPTPQLPYFAALFGWPGVYVAWVFSLLAIFSTFNAGIMGGSRLIMVLTREGNLPKVCAAVWLRTGAPAGGILLLGGFATVAAVCIVRAEDRGVSLAAVVGSSIVAFVYAAFLLAAQRLRRTRPDAKRSFRSPVWPWLQWLMIVLLPLLGIASLFSDPALGWYPLAGFGMLTALAASLAGWSLAHSRAVQQPRESTRTAAPS